MVLIEWNAVYTTWHTNVKMAHKCKGKVTYYSKYDWTFHVLCACVLFEIDLSQKCIYICHCSCQHLHLCVCAHLYICEVADKFCVTDIFTKLEEGISGQWCLFLCLLILVSFLVFSYNSFPLFVKWYYALWRSTFKVSYNSTRQIVCFYEQMVRFFSHSWSKSINSYFWT